jgi:hypothetical protein
MGFAALLLSLPRAPERQQVPAENQERFLLIHRRQSVLDPPPDRAFGDAKDAGDLINRVGAVDLDASPIWPSDTRFRLHQQQT